MLSAAEQYKPLGVQPFFGSKRLGKGGFAKGLVDGTGRVVVPARYDDVRPSSEGFAAVRSGDKWGFVDDKGKLVLPPKWLAVGSFSNGLAAVVVEKKEAGESMEDRVEVFRCGYIDTKGTTKVEPAWVHDCGPFWDGRARWIPFNPAAHTERKGGFIDTKGKLLFVGVEGYFGGLSSLVERGPGDFSEGFVFLPGPTWKTGGRLLKTNGEALELEAGWLADGPMSDGLARVRLASEATDTPKSPTVGFVDVSGKVRLRVEGYAGDFHDGLTVFSKEKNGPYGYIDRCGQTIVPLELLKANDFSEALGVAQDKTGYIVLGVDGKVKFRLEHTPSSPGFQGGVLRVIILLRSINAKGPPPLEGYVNRQGQYVFLSDGVEKELGSPWVKAHYVGPEPLR